MKASKPDLLVLFAHPRRGSTPRDRVVTWLVGILSRSEHAHVAVAFDGAVLNPFAGGDRWYGLEQYLEHYPGLNAAVRVPIDGDPGLADRWRGRRRIWPSLLRWATGGRVRSEDCVSVACDILREHGTPPPPRIVTPDQLLRWLTRGEEHAQRTTLPV